MLQTNVSPKKLLSYVLHKFKKVLKTIVIEEIIYILTLEMIAPNSNEKTEQQPNLILAMHFYRKIFGFCLVEIPYSRAGYVEMDELEAEVIN